MKKIKIVVELNFVPGLDSRETAQKFHREGNIVAVKVTSGGESFSGTGMIKRIEEED
jgi:hypothetical protein